MGHSLALKRICAILRKHAYAQRYLFGGRFWNGSMIVTSIGAKWRTLRERIVRSCRRAVAAIAMSAKPGQ